MDKADLFIKQGNHELVFNERISLLNDDDLRIIFNPRSIDKRVALFIVFFEGDPSDSEVTMSEIEDTEFNDYKIYRCRIPLAKKRKSRSGFNLKPIKMPLTEKKDINFLFNLEGYREQWNIQLSAFVTEANNGKKT